jgi:hypothetical protein
MKLRTLSPPFVASRKTVLAASLAALLAWASATTLEAAGLRASDAEAGDGFGFAVGQSGSIALVGARTDNIGTRSDQGSAYIFRNLNTATGTITQNVKLTASDGARDDEFGFAVSQSGGIGLVGTPFNVFGVGQEGSAYLFRNLDTATGTITQNAKLTASDRAPNDQFGYAVSQSGTIGLVGARLDGSFDEGSAYVFRGLDTATGTITENVKLTASDAAAGDEFGRAVSQSGSIGLVGAYGDDIGTQRRPRLGLCLS